MIYIFGDCELDMQRYVLRCAGRVIHVRRKAFQVLGYLLRHRDRVITKQELAEQVWQDDFVSDAALESAIKAVRQAIGDSGRGQRYVQTVYGVGYRFTAAAEERLEAQAGSVGETSPALSNTPPTSADHAHIIPPSPLLDEGVEESDGDRKVDVRDEPPWPPEALTPTAEWKVVTVLCCAPADATPESAPQEPETRYRHIQALYALTQPVVQGYEGNLQPVVGERILAVFGAPAAQEDHAQRAVRAALDLQRRLREANVDSMARGGLAVRIGLHTGVVAVGGLGDSPTTAGAIVGDAVAGVIALQDRAAPGTIECSAATAHLVRGIVQLAAADPVLVPGQSTPMSAYTVLGPRGRLRLMSPGGSRVRTPFVGRRRELKTLRALLAQAEAGHGQVIGLVGEPGIGKSRLVYEFQRSLRDRPVTYLAAGCVSHGAATPYLPILPLLRRNCGLMPGDSAPTIAAKVRASLEEMGLAPEPWAPYLLQLLGVTVGIEGFTALSHEVVKAHTVEALVQLALHGARRRPLVLGIENLHWIDPSSQEVVAALVERLVGARVLLLLTYRPGYRPHWIAKSYATQIALSRLRVQESRRVVQAILRKEPVPEPVVQDILARAEGNPLFLEELAGTVKERGAFQRALVVPTTLQAVLAARIDRLPAEAKHVLRVAAVIGREVAVSLLEAVAGLPSTALRQILALLQAAELLYEQPHVVPPTLTFKHTLIRRPSISYYSRARDSAVINRSLRRSPSASPRRPRSSRSYWPSTTRRLASVPRLSLIGCGRVAEPWSARPAGRLWCTLPKASRC